MVTLLLSRLAGLPSTLLAGLLAAALGGLTVLLIPLFKPSGGGEQAPPPPVEEVPPAPAWDDPGAVQTIQDQPAQDQATQDFAAQLQAMFDAQSAALVQGLQSGLEDVTKRVQECQRGIAAIYTDQKKLPAAIASKQNAAAGGAVGGEVQAGFKQLSRQLEESIDHLAQLLHEIQGIARGGSGSDREALDHFFVKLSDRIADLKRALEKPGGA